MLNWDRRSSASNGFVKTATVLEIRSQWDIFFRFSVIYEKNKYSYKYWPNIICFCLCFQMEIIIIKTDAWVIIIIKTDAWVIIIIKTDAWVISLLSELIAPTGRI